MNDERVPLPRDENRFRYLSHEPAPHELGIPDGYSEPFDMRTTRERIAERQKWLAETECCPNCRGLGRVTKGTTESI